MAEIAIKLKIADREYPMRVDASAEEHIRRAGKEINEQLKAYQDKFKLEDKQDLLAMVAFDSWMERQKQEASLLESEKFVQQKLIHWDQLLSSALTD